MFRKISTQEHLCLLAIYHGLSVPEGMEKFQDELVLKKLVINKEEKYFVSKMGLAFIHQQRDPQDLTKFERADLHFLTKVQKVVCDQQAATKLMDVIFNSKSKENKPKEAPKKNYSLGSLGSTVSEEIKEKLAEVANQPV